MFPGFENRLRNELVNKVDGADQVNIIANPKRQFASWIGGSLLASLSSFGSMRINKEEYEEEGATVVHRKCF